jgi:predicted ATPase
MDRVELGNRVEPDYAIVYEVNEHAARRTARRSVVSTTAHAAVLRLRKTAFWPRFRKMWWIATVLMRTRRPASAPSTKWLHTGAMNRGRVHGLPPPGREPRSLFCYGEPGTGKTTLADLFIERYRRAGRPGRPVHAVAMSRVTVNHPRGATGQAR